MGITDKLSEILKRMKVIENYFEDGITNIKYDNYENTFTFTCQPQYGKPYDMVGKLEDNEFFYGIPENYLTNEWFDIMETVMDGWTKEMTNLVKYDSFYAPEKEPDIELE